MEGACVQSCSNILYMILSTLLDVLWLLLLLLCLCACACLVWIQPALSVAILISHSESMRVWVCVTGYNGISILPGPWTVALWLRQIHTATHPALRNIYTNQTCTPKKIAANQIPALLNSGAEGLICQLSCHLPDTCPRKGHYYIFLAFSGFEPTITHTQTISCGADSERGVGTVLTAEAEAVIGK